MPLVREANREDLTRVLALYRQLHPDDVPLDRTATDHTFNAISAAPHLHLFVLDDDAGCVQATCYLNIIANLTRRAAPYGIIENVVTEEALRGRGMGKHIIGHALDFAWRTGCYKVMLQTGSRRASTHAFYTACGFSGSDKSAFVARPPA